MSYQTNNSEPVLNLPPAVKYLCLANLIVFALLYVLPYITADGLVMNIMYKLSFTPSDFSLKQSYTLITHLFVHAGFLHLATNMGMLMGLGTAVENFMGSKKFLIFYFATGVCASLCHAALSTGDGSMVGASGAVSGLLGGIMFLMNRSKISSPAGKKAFIRNIIICIIFMAVIGMLGMPGIDGAIAWVAHIGGFISGLLLFKPITRLNV